MADDHSNSVIVSAPDSLMAIIEKVVEQIDVDVQATTTIEVFKLKHADPVEMAELLANLFPDENSTLDAARQQSQFGGRGASLARCWLPIKEEAKTLRVKQAPG